jgi:hypothetical protein
VQGRAAEALEAGRVLFLPRLEFALEPGERAFLSASVLDGTRKNISLDPATGRVHGTSLSGDEAARLAAMMDRFGQLAGALVSRLVPAYALALERARTSYRPVEVEDRPGSVRHDDRLLHVDAFPSRPLRGRRILRVFSNIAPEPIDRQWRVGEPFEAFARRFLPSVRSPLPGTSWMLDRLGVTKGRRSAYDALMLALHDRGKLDRRYQQEGPRAAVAFPPGSTWIVFTDMVLHAAVSGRFALEQTFHIPVNAMVRPEQSPLRILERLSGRKLVAEAA